MIGARQLKGSKLASDNPNFAKKVIEHNDIKNQIFDTWFQGCTPVYNNQHKEYMLVNNSVTNYNVIAKNLYHYKDIISYESLLYVVCLNYSDAYTYIEKERDSMLRVYDTTIQDIHDFVSEMAQYENNKDYPAIYWTNGIIPRYVFLTDKRCKMYRVHVDSVFIKMITMWICNSKVYLKGKILEFIDIEHDYKYKNIAHLRIDIGRILFIIDYYRGIKPEENMIDPRYEDFYPKAAPPISTAFKLYVDSTRYEQFDMFINENVDKILADVGIKPERYRAFDYEYVSEKDAKRTKLLDEKKALLAQLEQINGTLDKIDQPK